MTEPVRVAYRALEKRGGSGVERGDLCKAPVRGIELVHAWILMTTLSSQSGGRKVDLDMGDFTTLYGRGGGGGMRF